MGTGIDPHEAANGAATASGSLPLVGPGAVLGARGRAGPHTRRLARTGALAAEHPSIAAAWAAGVITREHVDAIARTAAAFTAAELAGVIGELAAHWGQSPAAVARFVTAAARMLHPPAGARRADALVELVNNTAATGYLPTRGGLPVSLTVPLDHTTAGDPLWATSRGHHLTPAEQRFTTCDPTPTPLLLNTPHSNGGSACTGNSRRSHTGIRDTRPDNPGSPGTAGMVAGDTDSEGTRSGHQEHCGAPHTAEPRAAPPAWRAPPTSTSPLISSRAPRS